MDELQFIGIISILQSMASVLVLVKVWKLEALIRETPGSRGVEYERDGKTIKRVWIS